MKNILIATLLSCVALPALTARDLSMFILVERNKYGESTYTMSEQEHGPISTGHKNITAGIDSDHYISKKVFSDILSSFRALDLSSYRLLKETMKKSELAETYFVGYMKWTGKISINRITYLIPINSADSKIKAWINKYKDAASGKRIAAEL